MITIYILSCIKQLRRSLFALLMPATLSGCLTSCFEHNNRGLPSAVYFPAEGGTKTINGTVSMSHFEIFDDKSGNTLAISEENDIDSATNICSYISASYDWIEVKQEYGSTLLEITVAPLENNKDRKVYIDGYYGREYAEIKIIQKKNK